jgi:hypothetical protein
MNPKMKNVRPTEADKNFRNDMLALLGKYTDELPQERMLAVASYTVGQIIAMQDQTKFTSESVMALVSENIEAGNRDAVQQLFGKTSGSA